jgi:DNA-binding response OmpR family regulator
MARILVVEDENLVAMQVTWMIEDGGHSVVGPERSVEAARALLVRQKIDLALLDVTLRGETVFPVAKSLDGLHVPYIFITGHSSSLLPEQYRDRPLVTKPCQANDLLGVIQKVLGDQPRNHTLGTAAERTSAASRPPPDAMKA